MSFPSYDVWILKGFPLIAWISLVPIFLYIRDKSFKDIFISVFLTGIAGNFLAFGWIGSFGAKVPGGDIVILFFLIPTLAICMLFRIAVAEFLSRRYEKLRFLIFPAVWIIFDFIQASGFLAFPWVYWGYSQYPFTSLIQIVSVTGILGLNFLMIAVNFAFSDIIYSRISNSFSQDFFRRPEFKKFAAVSILVVIVTIAGFARLYIPETGSSKGFRVSIVQSCISPWENWSENKFKYLSELFKITEDALKENPDLVVWSESATLETISYNYNAGFLNSFDSRLMEFVKKSGKYFVTGEIGVSEGFVGDRLRRYPQNNAVLINSDGNVVDTYPKINLVPFGEWFPYEKWFPSIKRLVVSMGGSDFVPGFAPKMFNIGGKKFGVLICYEGIFFRLCRDYRSSGADFMINITNDGWTDKYSGHMQHFAASVLRSVENGVWYVRAGNTGYSTLIDPKGRITVSRPILTKGFVTGDIDFSMNRETFYTKTGDLIFYASFMFAVLLFSGILISYIKKIMKPE